MGSRMVRGEGRGGAGGVPGAALRFVRPVTMQRHVPAVPLR